MKSPTSSDVARLAGVSRSTVSFVLNGAPVSIGSATRERVLEAARKLNYQPNLAAKSLVEGSSRTILLEIAPSAYGTLVFEVMAELTAALSEHGFVVAVHLDAAHRHSLVATALRVRPRQLLLSRPLSETERAQLDAAGISASGPLPMGTSDIERLTSRLRVEHLVQRGHRQIAVVERSTPGLEGAVEARRSAILAAAREAQLPSPLVVTIEDGGGTTHTVNQLVDAGVTAICAFNDDAALAILRAIADSGFSCPEDLAVIGADATYASSVSFPPLTTVAIDAQRFSEFLAPAILATLGVTTPLGDAEQLPSMITLIERGST